MSDDFKTRLISHAQAALDRAGRAQSEAATGLVQEARSATGLDAGVL